MGAPTIELPAWRYATIQQNDTLQLIALRELGDASLWTELIAINGLVSPYLTGDESVAGNGVLLYGQSLIIPAAQATGSQETDPNLVFGKDLALVDGLLSAGSNGDLAVVSGRANLIQAYSNRLDTPLNELLFHPDYGNGVHELVGEEANGGTATLAAQFTRSALLADPRTDTVDIATATVTGDSISVRASVTPVVGSSVDVSATASG